MSDRKKLTTNADSPVADGIRGFAARLCTGEDSRDLVGNTSRVS
jgi:hypothetical protein